MDPESHDGDGHGTHIAHARKAIHDNWLGRGEVPLERSTQCVRVAVGTRRADGAAPMLRRAIGPRAGPEIGEIQTQDPDQDIEQRRRDL